MSTTLPRRQTSNSESPPVRAMAPEAEQIASLVRRLLDIVPHAKDNIGIVRAPLRICPLGAHIDHQLGVVTGMTIDQAVLMAFVPTKDGSVHVESLNFADPARFRMDDVPPYRHGDWANYVRGAVLALCREHQLQQGLVGVVGGQMPIGGLSSSAAVTITYLLALEAINGLAVRPAQNVELCRYTENRYIGLNNGILDQSVILYSEQNHLTQIDCQSIQIETIPAPIPGTMAGPSANNGVGGNSSRRDFEVLVVYSGVTHALVGTDYNNRVAECHAAAQTMLSAAGRGSLRELKPEEIRLRHVPDEIYQAEAGRLEGPLRRRATHYFGEMARVDAGVRAWRSGDLAHFGQLVSESGESSIRNYECGSPQLITLYEILRETPGVYGTRFSGAGFRGNCIALVDPAHRTEIAEAIHARYPQMHPAEASRYSIHFCQPDGPARLLQAPTTSVENRGTD